MKHLSRKQQQKNNFYKLGIGSASLPPIDYITSLTEYREDYLQEQNFPVSTDIDLVEPVDYCTFRINESNSADYGKPNYLASAYTLPDFLNQPVTHFGLSGDNYELQRKYYFLKYYLYYKQGQLNYWSGTSALPYISGAPSAFDYIDLTKQEYCPYVEGAVNNFLDSLDKPEEHITKTALDEDSKEKLNTVNDVSHNDMLDEFEKEYQAFIEKLKQQRAEKLR